MKTKILVLLTLSFVQLHLFAQSKKTKATSAQKEKTSDEQIYKFDVDVLPEYIGGNKAMKKFFLQNNLFTKNKKSEDDTLNQVTVRTIIDKNGGNYNPEIIVANEEKYNTEALRLVKKMPKWKPAMQANKTVLCYADITICFPDLPRKNIEPEEKAVPKLSKDIALTNPVQELNTNKEKPKTATKTDAVVDEKIYEVAEIMPEFAGGDDALEDYIKKHNNFTKKIKPEDDITTIDATVVIDEKGKAINPVFTETINAKYEAEIMRLLKTMPKWKPAMQNGHAVKCYTTISFDFPEIKE